MDLEGDASVSDTPPAVLVRQWMELLSAALMAAATIGTAWSAYQSSLWEGEQIRHQSQSTSAIVRVGKLSNLAVQRTSVHVNLFVHWASAVHKGDTQMADFLFVRFPEPLKTAARAWWAANPLTNSGAPASPFDMPEYVLPEKGDADRWEQTSNKESAAADRAGEISSRYLLFTIVFASVLFFAGVGGKFKSQMLDLSVLVLGALTLLTGLVIMLLSPRM
jgi:hypothetical protein